MLVLRLQQGNDVGFGNAKRVFCDAITALEPARMSPRRHRALTMVDVTIVILILGLMAALAAPRFTDSIRRTKLQVAARQTAAHIDYIRRVAVNEARTTTFHCSNTSHRYGSGEVDFPERHGELIYISIRDEYDPAFTLTADFDSNTSLSFNFEGVPYVGSTPLADGSLVLAFDGTAFEIEITPGTGATTVRRLIIQDQGNGVGVGQAREVEVDFGASL